jgi:hypothetical protein
LRKQKKTVGNNCKPTITKFGNNHNPALTILPALSMKQKQ